jgi:hypothetical protein
MLSRQRPWRGALQPGFCALQSRGGGNQREIISAVGLDEARLRNPLSRISGQVALRLFKFLQTHFNDPAIHLRVGQKAGAQSFSDVGYGALLETDLGAVIRAGVQVQALRQNMVRTVFYSDGTPPYSTWECPPDLVKDYASIVEFLVVSFTHLSRQVLDEAPLLPSMHFRHQPQLDIAIYEATFGCPVRFGMPQTRMEMLGRQVFRPSPFANQPLFDKTMRNHPSGRCRARHIWPLAISISRVNWTNRRQRWNGWRHPSV